MSEELGVDEVAAIVLDESGSYDLSPKALHKILYFSKKEMERENVSTDIPRYWYMYGAMVATSGTSVRSEKGESGRQAVCSMNPSEISTSEATIQRTRRAVNRALNSYYEQGLEGITDGMYGEAPYEVQRCYRRLDEQLETAADDGQMTLDGGKNEERTRDTLYDFIDAFPEEEFSEFADDLNIWYRLMSAEIDSDDYDPERAQRLAQEFWRLFCLELACRVNSGLSREEIARELSGVETVEQAQSDIRASLIAQEQKKAKRNSEGGETAKKAAEAFALPFVDIEVNPGA